MLRLMVFALFLLAFSMSANAQTSINREIIDRWAGGDYVDAPNSVYEAWLVPIDLLKLKYEDWSSSEKQRISKTKYEKFHAMLARVGASGRPYDCAYSSTGLYVGGTPKPITLIRRAEVSREVVIGKVEKVVPVWEIVTEKLSALVYLRVEESLKGAIPVGTVVKYYRSDSLVQVGRVTLCSRRFEPEKESQAVAESDVAWLENELQHKTYLIAGKLSPVNKWFIDTAPPNEFKVMGGAAFEAGEPTGLNQIYESLLAQ